jgi:NitT/TauT family transport system permease protein
MSSPSPISNGIGAPLGLINDRANLSRRRSPIGAHVSLLRRLTIIAVLALAWQLYARWLNNPVLLPTLAEASLAWWRGVTSGELLFRTGNSLAMLGLGYGAGLVLAAILTIVAFSSRIGADLFATLTAMFNPLPGIALLPLAMMWFGLGLPSMIFVLIHAVLWPVALNSYAGFTTVLTTLRMVGPITA